MTDEASLKLKIDSTEVDKGTKSLDDLAKAGAHAEQATKSLTSAATEQKIALKNLQEGQMGMSIAESNAKDKAWALANGYKEVNGQLLKTAEVAGHAGAALNAGVTRELITLGREAATGNFSRMPGTMAVLAARSGMTSAAMVGLAGAIVLPLAALAGLTIAIYEGSKEMEAMDNAIAVTNDYAGLTRSGMESLAKSMSLSGQVTIGTSKDIVTALVASGRVGSAAIGEVARLTADFARATGKDIEKVAPEMIKLFSDPAKGAEELNKSMHFLAAADIEHIATLERLGEVQKAQLFLAEKLSDHIPKETADVGLLTKFYRNWKIEISGVVDSLESLGKTDTIQGQIKKTQDEIQTLRNYGASETDPRIEMRKQSLALLMDEYKAQEQLNMKNADATAANEKALIVEGELKKTKSYKIGELEDTLKMLGAQQQTNQVLERERDIRKEIAGLKKPDPKTLLPFDAEADFWFTVQEKIDKDAAAAREKAYADADKAIAAANKKAASESAAEWKRFQDNVQRDIGDVLYLGLQGKFKDIGDLFKQLLLRMTADAGAARLTQAMFGSASGLAGGVPASGTLGAGMAGAATNLSWGFNAYNAGATVGGVAEGGSGMATLGAMGAAVAPYAAAAAAAYVVAKYGFGWGNSRENVGGQRLVGQFSNAGFAGDYRQSWKVEGGWFGGGSTGEDTTALTSAQSKAFKDMVTGFQNTFNTLGDTIGYAAVKTQAWTVDINKEGDVTGTLADAMGAQLLPSLVHLQAAGENLAQTAQRVNDAFVSTTQLIAGLGLGEQSAFGSIGIASADARLALIAAAGGLQNFTSLASQFVTSILSPAQQLQISLDAVGMTFAKLNIHGVETNAQFAELVKSELALGNYDIVTQLMNVSGAFANITKSAAALASQLKTDSFKTMVEYQHAIARESGAGTSVASATAAATAQLPALNLSNRRQELLDEIKILSSRFPVGLIIKYPLAEPFWSSNPDVIQYEKDKAELAKLPSYAVGTSYVPHDMTANIHKGERILPAASNDAFIGEIRALRIEVAALRASSESTARSTEKTQSLLRNVTRDGQSLLTSAA